MCDHSLFRQACTWNARNGKPGSSGAGPAQGLSRQITETGFARCIRFSIRGPHDTSLEAENKPIRLCAPYGVECLNLGDMIELYRLV
jgi:hypothetical protein